MKYLKTYIKLFESSDAKELFGDDINNQLIQDIKDMSLEYIDEGYILSYSVFVYDRQSNGYLKILSGEFSHSDDDNYEDYNVVDYSDHNKMYHIKTTNFLKNLKTSFRYDIGINNFYKFNDHESLKVIGEYVKTIINRITEMYPDENIQISE